MLSSCGLSVAEADLGMPMEHASRTLEDFKNWLVVSTILGGHTIDIDLSNIKPLKVFKSLQSGHQNSTSIDVLDLWKFDGILEFDRVMENF